MAAPVVDDHEVIFAERRDGNLALAQPGDRNGGGRSKRVREGTISADDIHHARATVGDVGASFRIDVAIFAERDSSGGRFRAWGGGTLRHGEDLLTFGVEYDEAGRWRCEDVGAAIGRTADGTQSWADRAEEARLGGHVAFGLDKAAVLGVVRLDGGGVTAGMQRCRWRTGVGGTDQHRRR